MGVKSIGDVVSVAIGVAVAGAVSVGLVVAVSVEGTIVVRTTTRRTGGSSSWTNGESRIAAEHGHARAVLGATKGHHVFAKKFGQ